MGVTYNQIEEMIETGDTEETSKQKIIDMFRASMHKRDPIPKYIFDRKNYLIEIGKI